MDKGKEKSKKGRKHNHIKERIKKK